MGEQWCERQRGIEMEDRAPIDGPCDGSADIINALLEPRQAVAARCPIWLRLLSALRMRAFLLSALVQYV